MLLVTQDGYVTPFSEATGITLQQRGYLQDSEDVMTNVIAYFFLGVRASLSALTTCTAHWLFRLVDGEMDCPMQ